MPGILTDAALNAVLDQLAGGKPFAPPAVLWVGASRFVANPWGVADEPSTSDYARVQLLNDRAHFLDAWEGFKATRVPILFGTPARSWGRIRSVFLADAPSGGTILAMAALPAPRPVDPGAPLAIEAGALQLGRLTPPPPTSRLN